MKINIDYDTKTKEANITVNGQTFENVSSLHMYNMDYDDSDDNIFGMEIRRVDRSREEGVTIVTSVNASQADANSFSFVDKKEKTNDKLVSDIAKLFE